MTHVLKRATMTLVVAAGLVLGTVGAAAATTSYVGGGTWWHGLTATTVYSNYFHSTRCHGSTAVGDYTSRSRTVGAGHTSKAEAGRALTNNETYWRYC